MRMTQKRLTMLTMAVALAWSLVQAISTVHNGSREFDPSPGLFTPRK